MAVKNLNNQRVKTSRQDVVILIIGMAVLVASVVLLILEFTHKSSVPQVENPEVDVNLSELHNFPPIDFVDSLYYKKVAVSYTSENGDESPRDVFYYKLDSNGQPTDERVHETHYYPGNRKYIDGNVASDARDGLWYAYHKNGNVQTMAHYKNGVEEGRYVVYYENGAVYYTGMYKAGKRVGIWAFYDEQEQLLRTEDYDKK